MKRKTQQILIQYALCFQNWFIVDYISKDTDSLNQYMFIEGNTYTQKVSNSQYLQNPNEDPDSKNNLE